MDSQIYKNLLARPIRPLGLLPPELLLSDFRYIFRAIWAACWTAPCLLALESYVFRQQPRLKYCHGFAHSLALSTLLIKQLARLGHGQAEELALAALALAGATVEHLERLHGCGGAKVALGGLMAAVAAAAAVKLPVLVDGIVLVQILVLQTLLLARQQAQSSAEQRAVAAALGVRRRMPLGLPVVLVVRVIVAAAAVVIIAGTAAAAVFLVVGHCGLSAMVFVSYVLSYRGRCGVAPRAAAEKVSR